MFIHTNTRKHLITVLKANIGKQVVIHYNCSSCDDEQVTYAQEYDNDRINEIKKDKCIYLHIPCTECGASQISIDANKNIQGIEIL